MGRKLGLVVLSELQSDVAMKIGFVVVTTLVFAAFLAALPVWALQAESQNLVVSVFPASGVPETREDLGMLLFFDPRISGDAQVSCSDCHMPDKAWTDGIALSAGYTGTLYFRNTPTLINAGKMPLLDWDGRFAQGDMTSVIRDHLAEAHFLNIDGRLMVERLRQVPTYEDGFKDVFGSEVSYGNVLTALAAFVGTMNSQNTRYQQYLGGNAGALTAQEISGLELFEGKAGCAQCHSGPLLSDGDLHALGVADNRDIFQEPLRHITFRRFFRAFGIGEYVTMRDDPGLYALTFVDDDRGKFRTPSLLEVARTAPYMHNGALRTLEDVVRFYNQGGGSGAIKDPLLTPLRLSDLEIDDLVAFLESLASDEVAFNVPELPPYQVRTLGEN